MPSRNIVKKYAANHFYHIYSRGVDKQVIFKTEADYRVFASLFKRYLSDEASQNLSRHFYPKYNERLELIAYSLMPNHIHLLIYQHDENAMAEFMKSLLTSYSMYFNKTNKRVGPIFQSRYKASVIEDQSYLEHISRYIHLNPRDWRTSDKTSIGYYLSEKKASWIKPHKIMDIFKNKQEYLSFMEDHEGHKVMLEEIKWDLADSEAEN